MEPRRELTLDERLHAYLSAHDAYAEAALEELVSKGIRPLGIAILRNKLRVSMRPDDDTHLNQVGLDMLSDVVVELLVAVMAIRSGRAAVEIESFHAYATTAVNNAYRQYLRAKYPERLSLRNKIRYILLKRPEYGIWAGPGGDMVCGATEWRHESREPTSTSRVLSLADDVRFLSDHAGARDNRALIRTVDNVIGTATAPVRLEDLVALIWMVMGATEATIVSVDEAPHTDIRSDTLDIAEQYEVDESFRRLWQAVKTIPINHRRALLLNLTDGRGDNLIAFLPRLGIASIREIARTLEYDAEEFAEIWKRLPLDDLTIAQMLGVTRQQVINLRQTARAKLRRIGK